MIVHDDDIVVGMRATVIDEKDLKRHRAWWGTAVTITHIEHRAPFGVHALTVRYEDRTGDEPETVRRFARKHNKRARIFRYYDGSMRVLRLVLGEWPEQPDDDIAF